MSESEGKPPLVGGTARSKVITCDLAKANRLAARVRDAIIKYLDEEPMNQSEIVLALNKILLEVFVAREETCKEPEKPKVKRHG